MNIPAAISKLNEIVSRKRSNGCTDDERNMRLKVDDLRMVLEAMQSTQNTGNAGKSVTVGGQNNTSPGGKAQDECKHGVDKRCVCYTCRIETYGEQPAQTLEQKFGMMTVHATPAQLVKVADSHYAPIIEAARKDSIEYDRIYKKGFEAGRTTLGNESEIIKYFENIGKYEAREELKKLFNIAVEELSGLDCADYPDSSKINLIRMRLFGS